MIFIIGQYGLIVQKILSHMPVEIYMFETKSFVLFDELMITFVKKLK